MAHPALEQVTGGQLQVYAFSLVGLRLRNKGDPPIVPEPMDRTENNLGLVIPSM